MTKQEYTNAPGINRGPMGERGATKLFASVNLSHLLELNIHGCPIGKAAAALANKRVMPELTNGGLWRTGVPKRIKQLLGACPCLYVEWTSDTTS